MSSQFCYLLLFYLIIYFLVICDVQSASNGIAVGEMRSGCGLANNESTVEVVRNQTRYNTTFSPNEFPWHVYLTVNYISGDDSSNCGGFLIDSKWVLTTAHCFNTGTNKVANVTIYLGSRDVVILNEKNRVVLVSDKICLHPEYTNTQFNGIWRKDIALIRLPTEIKSDDNIRPICFPNSSYPDHVGDAVTLSGWHNTYVLGTSFIKVPSTVVSNSQCEPSYPNITNFNDQFICTLSTYSVYFYPFNCPIGRGGPVSYQNPDGSWTAIGLMTQCERKGYPVVFTRIKYYLDWIQTMKQNDSATCIAPSYNTLPPESTACGLANEPSSPNNTRSPNEFPWQVYLVVNRAGRPSGSCVGILIDSQWVLTAARCFDSGSDRVDNVTILLGSRSVMVRKMLISDKICIHPNYTNGVIRGKDIALIHLPTEMTINNNIRPVCLPNTTYPDHVGDSATLSGWQASSSSYYPGSKFTKGSLTVVSNSQCEAWFKTNNLNDQYICTLGTFKHTTTDFCREVGPGGPVNFKNPDGSWTAIGLMSGCDSKGNPPAISTRIKYHLDWIQSVKSGNNCTAPFYIPQPTEVTALTTLSTGANGKLSTTTKPFTGCDDSSANSILVSSSAMTIIIAAVVFLSSI